MRIVYDSVKRIFDVFAASIAVLVFLIPWIIISVIINKKTDVQNISGMMAYLLLY